MHYEPTLSRIGLLWLSGLSLRLTILALPPVISLIQIELQLSASEIGLLAGLPIALLALAALPGALLIQRFGALSVLIGGLIIVSMASATRGAAPGALSLYLATMVMGIGIAVMQIAMPTITRQWLPARVGLGTAVYTNGMVVGGVVPVWLTLPVILPLVGGSWRLGLTVWSIPITVTAVLVVLLAPRPQEASEIHKLRNWRPTWGNATIWRIGLIFGSINSVYFTANAFIPTFLADEGRDELITYALTALNMGQLVASIMMLVLSGRLERRVWPCTAAGALMLLALSGLVSTLGALTVLSAAMLGFSAGVALVVGLTLPALVSPPREVAATSAAMFTISYTSAVIVSILSGAAWDISGIPAASFGPVALCAMALIVLTTGFRIDRPSM